ncbi:serine/threonine protein kinase [Galdieria sulphuraria]|uniref:Serine/threonine protein kinase n=1 Tax=Galdieria sulphuraria TaxID=130081 RepID=M2Y152_GALSU|nr:serine/threonine protein kinase [Galdieria sulphuraria]EME29653.1 serine/threonine protein kinase [Galdieria sulphuraria]|eukprot:XP_005706173.1 serine/threonine protein kinase [Galdieria sulphuraria]
MAPTQRQPCLEKVQEKEQLRRKQRVEWACRSHAVSSMLTKKYQLDCLLSRGSSAIILSGKRLQDNFPVVVKVIKTSSLTVTDSEYLETEISIFDQLINLRRAKGTPSDMGSYHVLSPIEVIRDPINQNVYLISEHLQGGDLFSRLESMKGYLMTESEVLWLLRQMLSGLCFLHRLGISHRDVKLENFVFVETPSKNSYDSVLKIIDFGLCHWNQSYPKNNGEDVIRCSEAVGTLHYVPPEIVKEKDYIPEKVDSWELGVVAYALITQKLPFDDWDDNNVFSKICTLPPNMRTPCWDRISLGTKQLIAQLLIKDESKRISCEEAFQRVEALLESIGAPHGVEADRLIRNLSHKQMVQENTARSEKPPENTDLLNNNESLSGKNTKQDKIQNSETTVACQPVMNWQSILTFFRRSRRSSGTKPEPASRSFDILAWKSQIRDKLKNSSPLRRRQAAVNENENQRVANQTRHQSVPNNNSQCNSNQKTSRPSILLRENNSS